MSRVQVVAVLLAGCGRLGFDVPPVAEAPDAAGEVAAPDAVVRLGPCGVTQVPDPLSITGTTVDLPTFGSAQPTAGVSIEASTMLDGQPMAQTSSAEDGGYALALPSGGEPVRAYITLRKPGMLPTVLVPDGPLDADLVALYSPVTSDSTVSSLYLAGGVVRKSAAGTLGIMVVDCDGTPVPGAVVTVAPPPAAMLYTDDAGSACPSSDATGAAGLVYALGVPLGTISVTAAKPGVTFFSHEITILDNTHVMGTRLRVVR